jgi:hypothetical protein
MSANQTHMAGAIEASLRQEVDGRKVAPCEDCRNAARCTAEQLACRALEIFHEFGRPSIAPRHPSAEIYVRMHARKPRPRPAEERRREREALAVKLTREAIY